MRKSGYEVDDAGDASNTEIGHVAYLPSRTSIAIPPRVRSCRLGGFLGGSGIWGKNSRPDGLSVRTVATAVPNETCVAVRDRDPCPVLTGPSEVPLTRRT
jgi:hypothetical protein